jgi:putative spermidine/putrescine transport system permease protein
MQGIGARFRGDAAASGSILDVIFAASGVVRQWAGLALAISILLAVGPIAVVILAAFSSAGSFVFPPPGFTLQWLTQFFETPSLTTALILSFEIAFAAATLSSCLAFIAAIALARMRSRPAAALIEAAFLAPLVFPSIILGVALLIFYRAVGLNLTAGLVIAHITVALPYAFRLIYSEIQAFDFTLNEAAASLGAGPAAGAYYVMLPIIWPGLLSGWTFGFVVSLAS